MSLPAHTSLSQGEAWVSLQHATWSALREQLAGTGRWRKEIVVVFLRHHAALHKFYPRRNPLPSVRELAKEIGWPPMTLSDLIRSGDWADPVSPCPWRASDKVSKPAPKLHQVQPIAPTNQESEVSPLDKLKALKAATANAAVKHDKHEAKVVARVAAGDVRVTDIQKAVEKGQALTGTPTLGWSHANSNSAKSIIKDIPTPLQYIAWVAENWGSIKPHLPASTSYNVGVLYGFRDTLYGFFAAGAVPEKRSFRPDAQKRVLRAETNQEPNLRPVPPALAKHWEAWRDLTPAQLAEYDADPASFTQKLVAERDTGFAELAASEAKLKADRLAAAKKRLADEEFRKGKLHRSHHSAGKHFTPDDPDWLDEGELVRRARIAVEAEKVIPFVKPEPRPATVATTPRPIVQPKYAGWDDDEPGEIPTEQIDYRS